MKFYFTKCKTATEGMRALIPMPMNISKLHRHFKDCIEIFFYSSCGYNGTTKLTYI